jgi:hypothetical protein
MAKAVADVNNPDEKQGGFASDDSEITGFSHMHDSGTGGVGCLHPVSNVLRTYGLRLLRWGTFPFFHRQDAAGMTSITASSPKPTALRSASMAR